MKELTKNLDHNLDYLQDELHADLSFDVLTRTFDVGNRKAGLIYLDGFIKDQLIYILNRLLDVERKDLSVDAIQKVLDKHLPYYEVSTVTTLDDAVDEILSGPQVLLIDGETEAIVIDGRTWMGTSPDEPELEKSTRGPGDGFVETMLFNVQMVRRRLRDPELVTEVQQVGARSKNDVAMLYIDDIVDPGLVKKIKNKIKKIKVDGLPMADKTIEDFLTGDNLNPLPKVRYTERPDIVSAHLLEGKICIIVDNSPTALILPATFFDQVQSLEDYRQPPLPGTYLKLLRLFATGVSLFLPVIWLLVALQPELLPETLSFIGPKETGQIPLGIQFIIASLGIDFVRMASFQVPSALATSLGIIGALLLGDFAAKVGLFVPETIIYMAIGAIGNFAISGFELALTIKLLRFILLILVTSFKLYGFIIGTVAIVALFVFSKSFGISYLWPLIPFDWNALKSHIIRQSILDLSHRRPNIHSPKDSDRYPEDNQE
ncbi:spore germination protein [Acetohalobium arabaticum]|uniref:GerA spore germination protein n=1 Tax=Acetohalobium arabaticum (strain ATCC 49924 / DSM 5501 / Z-7288) TaxID=574087 RepID=D9QRR3_ACEAZ|nr:spore germination protein [Acetohalobium arabaticum]ADL13204.1 GerA spore germination protein [Acetohalobium arabaticum DSM 5501]